MHFVGCISSTDTKYLKVFKVRILNTCIWNTTQRRMGCSIDKVQCSQTSGQINVLCGRHMVTSSYALEDLTIMHCDFDLAYWHQTE
jgi:hypothetical protein